jgi:hypothetical protein
MHGGDSYQEERFMDEEAITNMLNVLRHIERCRVDDEEMATRGNDFMSPYYRGRSDGHQQAGAILRNMLRCMNVAIPEDV